MFGTQTGAVFSGDGRYRYALWRDWQPGGNRALFIGLNPSTADQTHDDATIRRCIGFAQSWGYDGLLVGNLFAYRATRPEDLLKAMHPVGRFNRRWLKNMQSKAAITVACWGNHGRHREQDRYVMGLFGDLYCLKLNLGGAPAHALYLPKALRPMPFQKGLP